MDNFFGTCGLFDPHINYINYVADLNIYGATTHAYRENREKLLEAFYDITGFRLGRG
jgi:hypothetical protein